MDLEGLDDEVMGLPDDETDEIEERADLCLVGRFLTKKALNFMAMKSHMGELWKPVKGLHTKAF